MTPLNRNFQMEVSVQTETYRSENQRENMTQNKIVRLILSAGLIVSIASGQVFAQSKTASSKNRSEISEVASRIKNDAIDVYIPTHRTASDKQLKKVGHIPHNDRFRTDLVRIIESGKQKNGVAYVSPHYYLQVTSQDNQTTRIYGIGYSRPDPTTFHLVITGTDASRGFITGQHSIISAREPFDASGIIKHLEQMGPVHSVESQ